MIEANGLFETEGYLLDELLGEDAWGELYRARYVPHRREVMLRRFAGGLARDDGAWELALAEVQAWARLDHPGILQVLDWGRTQAGSFLVTEVPIGRSLCSILGEDSGVEDPDTVFGNILASLEAARRWGVLHLGLGLTNIWVEHGGAAQVSEFGLWYVVSERPGLIEHDSPFVAPEQVAGGRVSAATDIYSLGLLFVALNFGLSSAREVSKGGPLPEELGDYRRVIARCLDVQPLARYRSAGEVAAATGLEAAECVHEGYRDCPLCRLKEDLRQGAEGRTGRWRADRWRETSAFSYVWLLVVALAVSTFLVWWFVLR